MAGELPGVCRSWRQDWRRNREEPLTHIESILVMILTEMEASGASPPPDEPV
jgi:hypothetical protein